MPILKANFNHPWEDRVIIPLQEFLALQVKENEGEYCYHVAEQKRYLIDGPYLLDRIRQHGPVVDCYVLPQHPDQRFAIYAGVRYGDSGDNYSSWSFRKKAIFPEVISVMEFFSREGD